MSKKRGMSMDDKRLSLLQLFHTSKDVFTLKELEKVCQKQCGISSMVIKDVLQEILNDNLVETDKCGINTVYWSFPSQAGQQKKMKIEQLQTTKDGLVQKIKQTEQQVKAERVGKDDSEERAQVLQELKKLEEEKAKIKSQLVQYAANDPDTLIEIEKETELALEAANRWIENIWTLKKYCAEKFNLEGSAFDDTAGEVFEDYIQK
eukprot:c4341_g1_i1.p1 GENE.c4341_g1_i1~~c4341_g1_i1.p1  ORF type:complete len:215 (+),score=98.42 c4341_g1_i1:30-647(+)